MDLDDMAFLFVEQYENIHGFCTESYSKSEVDLIRCAAEKGESALYTTVEALFGDMLDDALVEAASAAMDYIAYVDETWMPKDEGDKANTLATQRLHLESIDAILRMARQNERGIVDELERIASEARTHCHSLQLRAVDQPEWGTVPYSTFCASKTE